MSSSSNSMRHSGGSVGSSNNSPSSTVRSSQERPSPLPQIPAHEKNFSFVHDQVFNTLVQRVLNIIPTSTTHLDPPSGTTSAASAPYNSVGNKMGETPCSGAARNLLLTPNGKAQAGQTTTCIPNPKNSAQIVQCLFTFMGKRGFLAFLDLLYSYRSFLEPSGSAPIRTLSRIY